MAANKVRLDVCGSSYTVSTNDSEEYLLGLAERLDKDMSKMMQESPNASVAAAAVITALSYLDEAEKNAFGADNMRAQIQGYLEDASKAKVAAEEARREAERLRNELKYYDNTDKKQPKPQNSLLDYGQKQKRAQEASDSLAQEALATEEERVELEGQLNLEGMNDPL